MISPGMASKYKLFEALLKIDAVTYGEVPEFPPVKPEETV
jgi:hypothetical protein